MTDESLGSQSTEFHRAAIYRKSKIDMIVNLQNLEPEEEEPSVKSYDSESELDMTIIEENERIDEDKKLNEVQENNDEDDLR